MSYTITDVPLKKLKKIDWIYRAKRKCEHHKFSDGTEFMMYTITGRKKEVSFIFDPEDFDIVDGKEWISMKNGVIIFIGQNGQRTDYLSSIIGKKYYPDKYVGLFKINQDYRKSNLIYYEKN
ncbi:MAG: hypothetical protein Faunusvirus8_37 [Faunusvirus sp.]|jgi:hypothetical protein|uniref:Uncharacterized protein n=1 Tax=Faunusvirus sp. TaxID=2487766 RepID=A0A3G4ZWU9_9VIRU|nr:MAG: hypothetical protein Faunusvirus8_37 [Faunusvirus sp.]